MHIVVKNKFLYFRHYKVKCAIGKRGIDVKKKEGDLITPKGTYKIKGILYRKDRLKKLRSKLKKMIITKITRAFSDFNIRKPIHLFKFVHKVFIFLLAHSLHQIDNFSHNPNRQMIA